MVDYVKESTVGELIGDTFRLYGRNLLPLFLICLIPVLPFDFLVAVGVSSQNAPLTIVAQLLSAAGDAFVYGAITFAVSDICLGNRPSVRRSYAAIGRVLGRYLGTYFLVMLAFCVAVLMLVIPALVVSVLFMFALPVTIIERRRPIASIKRSIALGKGSYWRNFGVLMLALLVSVGVLVLLLVVFGVLAVLAGLDPEGFAFSLIGSIVVDFVNPLIQIPLVLLYYDMRVRKEFFDSAALSQEMFA
jgi:hypothetical protein